MLAGSSHESLTDSSMSKIKVLIAKRETLFKRVWNLAELGKRLGGEQDERIFLMKTQTLQSTRADYESLLDAVINASIELDPDFSPCYEKLELFDQLVCQILFTREQLLSQGNTISNSSSNKRPVVKLPPIELIKFYGDPAKFPAFAQIFRRVVDANPDLSDEERVHYLVSQLHGSASNVIAGIPPVGENYELIWSMLTAKYEDVRCLANSYFSNLLKFKGLTSHDAKNLNRFSDEFEASVAALKSLNIPDLADFFITHLALTKLDAVSIQQFEQSHDLDFPRFRDLAEFIRKQTRILTRSDAFIKISTPARESFNKNVKSHGLVVNTQDSLSRSGLNCELCNENHKLYHCGSFLSKSLSERIESVKQFELCTNCLRKHSFLSCKSKGRCFKCKEKHHTCLHPLEDSESNDVNIYTSAETGGPSELASAASHSCAVCLAREQETAFDYASVSLSPTALVRLGGRRSVSSSFLRILLDSGANNNFITAECCSRNFIKINYKHSIAYGLGNIAQPVLGFVNLTIVSRINSNHKYSFSALVVDRLASNLPSVSFKGDSKEVTKGMCLADDTFCVSSPIDCIVGAALLPTILGSRKTRLPNSRLYAVESSLGDLIMGEVRLPGAPSLALCSSSYKDFELEQEVHSFSEPVATTHRKQLSSRENTCGRNLQENVSRSNDGKFSVALPLRDDPSELRNSRKQASQIFSLEKHSPANPDILTECNATLSEYLERGYLQNLTKPSGFKSLYCPTCPVVYRSDKIPLGLDVSCKTFSLRSLIDKLYCGSYIRSDIKTMNLLIKVNPHRRRLLRELYKFYRDENVGVYEFSSLPRDLSSACYLAVRVLKLFFRDEDSPELRRLIESSSGTYVDDYLLPEQNISRAGFKLTKMLSPRDAVTLGDENIDTAERVITRRVLSGDLGRRFGQSFWNRWRQKYLNSLQLRAKWNIPSRLLFVGLVVLLNESNVPTLCLPLGIITELFPGTDGITRVARIKTRLGTYVRPAVRVFVLYLLNNDFQFSSV